MGMVVNNNKDTKPWAWLRMSRKQYDALRIWKKCNLSREEFGKFVLCLPSELIDEMYENATADMLVDAIFKTRKATLKK